jgi:hypothetical protein
VFDKEKKILLKAHWTLHSHQGYIFKKYLTAVALRKSKKKINDNKKDPGFSPKHWQPL